MATISWKTPIRVTDGGIIDCEIPDSVENDAGIYFFSRRHGQGPFQPFYIGKTVHIKTRLHQYLFGSGNHENRIRNVLEGGLDKASGVRVPNGRRYFHYGCLSPQKGLVASNAIIEAEKSLIQYARIVGWELINNHHARDAAFRKFAMKGKRLGVVPRNLMSHR